MVLSYAGGIDILSTPSPQFHTGLPKLKHVKQAFIFQLFRLFRSLTSFSLRFCCLLPSFALFLLPFRSLTLNAFFIVFFFTFFLLYILFPSFAYDPVGHPSPNFFYLNESDRLCVFFSTHTIVVALLFLSINLWRFT